MRSPPIFGRFIESADYRETLTVTILGGLKETHEELLPCAFGTAYLLRCTAYAGHIIPMNRVGICYLES